MAQAKLACGIFGSVSRPNEPSSGAVRIISKRSTEYGVRDTE